MITEQNRAPIYFTIMAVLLLFIGFTQSWNLTLQILNIGLISAVMALGVNLQWGYAGLFNAGIMGFIALGGLAVVLTAAPTTPGGWEAGGLRTILGLGIGLFTIVGTILIYQKMQKSKVRTLVVISFAVLGFIIYRTVFDPAVAAIEAVNPSQAGFLGGLGLPVLLAWPVGALFAAAAAWVVGKTALGLRSDYLAIATLGIAEIIIAVIKNEEWMTRGVKNVIGLPRPVPYEVNLQDAQWFLNLAASVGGDPVVLSSIFVKLCYSFLFISIVIFIITLMQLSLNSPWGRMVRAIRDNEISAAAMGKDVKARHLQIFVLGAAICGLGGAMMTTMDGQLTPTVYQPLRFTFLIWVMVIVGGSGNNWGAVLGGMLIWYLWDVVPIASAYIGHLVIHVFSLSDTTGKLILERLPYMRYMGMGLILLLVLRLNPRGLIPAK